MDEGFQKTNVKYMAPQYLDAEGWSVKQIRHMFELKAHEKTQRECLRCHRNFKAQTRFIRLCERCKKNERWGD